MVKIGWPPESSWGKLLHNEDRELQIRLAELQSDMQAILTTCFGLIALFASAMIGFEQLFFTSLAGGAPGYALVTFGVVIVVSGGLMVFCTTFFIDKMKKTRRQISELRKRHIW
jgi:hypothetical protein